MVDFCEYKIFADTDSIENPALITPWFIQHYAKSLLIFSGVFTFLVFFLKIFELESSLNMFYILIVLILTYLGGHFKFCDLNTGFELGGFSIISTAIFIFLLFLLSKVNISKTSLVFLVAMYTTLSIHTYYEFKTAGPGRKDEWWNREGEPSRSNILSNSYWNSVGDTLACVLACFTLYFVYLKVMDGKDFEEIDTKEMVKRYSIFLIISGIIYGLSEGSFLLLSRYYEKEGRVVGLTKWVEPTEVNVSKLKRFKGF